MKLARKRAQAIAKGRGRDSRVVIPLAFEVAARISARPLDEFRNDATQLANGLKELHQAVGGDGLVVALANRMEFDASDGVLDATAISNGAPVAASLEACRRLRETMGDEAVLLAGLTGPVRLAAQFDAEMEAAGECLVSLVKAFFDAGCDVIVLFDDNDTAPDASAQAVLKTAANVARFHQASLLSFSGQGLPGPVRLPLAQGAVEGLGFILTDAPVAPDADITALRQWVQDTRGA